MPRLNKGQSKREVEERGHLRWRHIGTLASGVGAHVSCGQLVPCVGKCSVQGIIVLGEHFDQFKVAGVMKKGNITREHPNGLFVKTRGNWLC